MSRNVPLTLLYKSLDGAASGVWSSGATSAYILLLFAGTSASATQAIGAAQALQGVALAACALPLAWAADKVGRARVARVGGVLALVAAVLTCASVLLPAWEQGAAAAAAAGAGSNGGASASDAALPAPTAADARSFRLLCGALAVWGAAAGVGPTVDALFADSLPTGRRASWFQLAYALSLASRSLGPLVAALVFWRNGDEWRLPALRRVILVGQAIGALPSAALFFLRDSAALGEESEGLLGRLQPAAAAGQEAAAGSSGTLTEPLLVTVVDESAVGLGVEDEAEAEAEAEEEEAEAEAEEEEAEAEEEEEEEEAVGANGSPAAAAAKPRRRRKPPPPPPFGLRQRHVPFILATTDLLGGLASGMTVKYTSIFFIQEVGMPPTAVNLVSALAPLAIAAASAAAARVARRAGRVQAMLAFKAPGVACLLWLAADRALWRSSPRGVALLFLARTGLANATYPLSRSILSDYVPKRSRARWNALEAVTAMSWSGSAALGGYVIERRGYGAAFAATAALQGVALLGQLMLLPLVPRREGGVLAAAAVGG